MLRNVAIDFKGCYLSGILFAYKNLFGGLFTFCFFDSIMLLNGLFVKLLHIIKPSQNKNNNKKRKQPWILSSDY